ncbi:3D domain protein [Bacillus phage DIGNKC]|uniref:L-alanyl-D-glutamate peptidase n=1 Tax=Bacillus phage DIGNKC TaxID=1805948 RepID=UPI0007A76907|nr:L-alanyl-D-glutamate peptidase [Bacillus phage DIGNKC]AMW62674.1 3D domain protein [Bacillus phage DIGNKC]AOZ61719.1 3D domain protein [Bacillus phage BJ4]AOZ62348.1 3D domain protein [Bacillus phage SBP8a]
MASSFFYVFTVILQNCYINIISNSVRYITIKKDKNKQRSFDEMKKLRNTLTGLVLGTGLLLGAGAASAEETSVVDFLHAKGESYDFGTRSNLAAQYGIEGYKGTANQNIQLLGYLQGDLNQPQPKKVQDESYKETTPQGKTIVVKATAYTAHPSENGGTYGGRVLTATGFDLTANPSAKIIAVDPRVIPLGSKVHVEGYGTAIASDTGGAIKGNRIDVLMPSQSQSSNWGVRTVKVTILN